MVHMMPLTRTNVSPDAATPSAMPLPEPHLHPFREGIAHPDLWLWDSWTLVEGDVWHLYCLALSRIDSDGHDIPPQDRNKHPFLIRHIVSKNGGTDWVDDGVYFKLEKTPYGLFNRQYWRGPVMKLMDGA